MRQDNYFNYRRILLENRKQQQQQHLLILPKLFWLIKLNVIICSEIFFSLRKFGLSPEMRTLNYFMFLFVSNFVRYINFTLMMRLASHVFKSAFPAVSTSLLRRQAMTYFKTPDLFVKSTSLRKYFMETIQDDGSRRIESLAKELLDQLGKKPNHSEMLDAFYQKLDAMAQLKFPLVNAEMQINKQDFKENLKVFFLLQIQHSRKPSNYSGLKQFGYYISRIQEQIAMKIMEFISEAEMILSNEKYPSVRQMLLEKLRSKEFQVYPEPLLNEFRRLFDFNMPFVIDTEVQQERYQQGSIKGFNTFCPTLTVTSKIFQLKSDTCFVVGSKLIGKSYSEFLLRHLRKYCSNKVFYIGNSIKCIDNSFLAKQLFQSCWDSLHPDDVDTLSTMYSQEYDLSIIKDKQKFDEQQFETIIHILKRNKPEWILIDQCNYLTSKKLPENEMTLKRFKQLISAVRRSKCIFSSSINTENQIFQQIVMPLRDHPPQQCHELQFFNSITNEDDLWGTLEFQMEKNLRQQGKITSKELISKHLEAIILDKDIRTAIMYLKKQFNGFNFPDITFLAKWILKNYKLKQGSNDFARFAAQMINQFIKDCIERLVKLTVEWVKRIDPKKQKAKYRSRVHFITQAIKNKGIILQQVDSQLPFQDFPNHLLQDRFKDGTGGQILNILSKYPALFLQKFNTQVKEPFQITVNSLIQFYNDNNETGVGVSAQSLIGKACEAGNAEIKNVIIRAFDLQGLGPINIQQVQSQSNEQIMKNLVNESLKENNYGNILFSYTKKNQQACDYFFMIRGQNLIVIFLECGLNKSHAELNNLVLQIYSQFLPQLLMVVPKDIKIDLRAWITTRNPTFLAVKDNFEVQSDKHPLYPIKVKITDLEYIYQNISKNAYNAAVAYRLRKKEKQVKKKVQQKAIKKGKSKTPGTI